MDEKADNTATSAIPAGSMACPLCACATNMIVDLIRAPQPPEEIRACERCVPEFENKRGMRVVGKRHQQGRSKEGALICAGCGDHSNRTVIMSVSGTSADTKACVTCAAKLQPQGWRSACVHGKL